MNPALWAAKTGLDAQQTRMTVVSHNLANVNTTGFKRGRAVFEDLLYQNIRQVGAQTSQNTQYPSGLHLGTGVRVVATEKMYAQGSLVQTSGPLDMAIEGRGFFQILMQVVTASGYALQPPINIPSDATGVTIGHDGTVTATLAGQSAPTQIGTLQLVDFINSAGLQPKGENLLLESAASGPPQVGTPGLNGLGTLLQGELESSNVNVAEELVDMIETQRAYEMNSKAVQTTDQMLQYAAENM